MENTRYTIHHVAFGNAQAFRTAEVKDEYSISVPSGPDTAKQMKPELSALAVCRLTVPFTTSDYYSDSATVNSPYASQNYEHYVMTDLLEVWIYDRKSGVIHAKLRPHE